ncbi:MAG TPA: hypothetical protein VGT44_23200 [Ktedonobacteraceae bacterium]|nr:hypothetical protein [Ktedonobacteraceae bacterium]
MTDHTAVPLPGYKCLVNLSSTPSVSSSDLALTDAGDHQTFTVPLASAQRYLDRAVAVTVQTQQDEIQTVTITGSPTGGTFTLTFGGNTTTGIAYNAAASAVQSALTALASIGANNVSVSGSNGGPWTVEFIGSLKDASQSLMTGNGGSLTGGSSPNVSIARTQAGQAWTTISSSSYTLRYLTAQVLLNAALLGSNIGLRLHAFNYYPYASIALANDITFAGQRKMLDVTALQGSSGGGWQSFIPGLNGGTFACKAWVYSAGAALYASNLASNALLILSFVDPTGNHAFESYGYTKGDTWHGAVANANEETINFQCDAIVALS